jgi:predicted metal-binding membrane protein
MPAQSLAGSAVSFLGTWVVMMVAMMLPSLAPTLWRYREAAGRAGVARADRFTAVVGTAYVLVWTVFGMIVFPIVIGVETVRMELPQSARAVSTAIGMVVLAAGALQFTGWKAHHLASCREAPRWRTIRGGAGTAVRDGLRIGFHCCLSCLGFVAILVAFGIMDLRAMAVVTVAITAERVAPSGARVARATGALALAVGLLLIAHAGGLAWRRPVAALPPHSHSMVAGGFELTSYTTRFTPRTSLMIRFEMRASTSCGNGNQSAVIPSRLVTARSATTFS